MLKQIVQKHSMALILIHFLCCVKVSELCCDHDGCTASLCKNSLHSIWVSCCQTVHRLFYCSISTTLCESTFFSSTLWLTRVCGLNTTLHTQSLYTKRHQSLTKECPVLTSVLYQHVGYYIVGTYRLLYGQPHLACDSWRNHQIYIKNSMAVPRECTTMGIVHKSQE